MKRKDWQQVSILILLDLKCQVPDGGREDDGRVVVSILILLDLKCQEDKYILTIMQYFGFNPYFIGS